MRTVVGYSFALLALSQFLVTAVARAEESEDEKTVREESIYTDTKSDALEVIQGFTSVIPLDFVPSVVSVGDPAVLGMDVVEGGKNPQLRLVGITPGATNLIVFDLDHAPRMVMEVTVGPKTFGEADKISVYRQTTLENVVCTAGQCEKLK